MHVHTDFMIGQHAFLMEGQGVSDLQTRITVICTSANASRWIILSFHVSTTDVTSFATITHYMYRI